MPKYTRFAIAAALGLVLQILFIGSAQGRQHIVAAGESLGVIAEMYSVTVGQLVDSNGISNPDVIYPGQALDIPNTGAGSTKYEVQPGDTLSAIAEEFGVSSADLQQANAITDPHLIVVGQVLSVPTAAPSPSQPSLPLADKPSDPALEPLFEEFAAYEGIDPGLVKALAWIESGWQQHVVSHTGAVGIMQLMPETTAWLESDIFGYDLHERDSAYDNIKLGVRYLRILMDATAWNEKTALASYYQGHGNTTNGILFSDTVDYVAAVLAVRDSYWP